MSEYRGCQLPEDLYYDLDYVWLRPGSDGLFTIGVTDPAQTMGGRILSVHIKKTGKTLLAGRHVATLESGKWVGGIPVPFAATIVERNEALLADPHLINVDPYGAGWIARLRPEDPFRRAGRRRPHSSNGSTATTSSACAARIRTCAASAGRRNCSRSM